MFSLQIESQYNSDETCKMSQWGDFFYVLNIEYFVNSRWMLKIKKVNRVFHDDRH